MTLLHRGFKSPDQPVPACDPSQRLRPVLRSGIANAEFTNWPNAMSEGTAVAARFDHLDIAAERDGVIYWAFMRPHSRPCFTTELLVDVRRMQRAVREEYARRQQSGDPQLKYVVLGSHVPGVYNLGGDLALFNACIKAGDREALQRYAKLCIEVVYDAAVNLSLPVITVALVQGDALGGGFEAALACNMIIAERSAKFGLPEILFNLFPGMGAYNLLSRRIGTALAEKIILSGRVYSADEMHEMGLVDLVADDGLGEGAVMDYVNGNCRRHRAERAVYHARQLVNPVRLPDLEALAEIWVETALGLGELDLRRIERLATAQQRRKTATQETAAAE